MAELSSKEKQLIFDVTETACQAIWEFSQLEWTAGDWAPTIKLCKEEDLAVEQELKCELEAAHGTMRSLCALRYAMIDVTKNQPELIEQLRLASPYRPSVRFRYGMATDLSCFEAVVWYINRYMFIHFVNEGYSDFGIYGQEPWYQALLVLYGLGRPASWQRLSRSADVCTAAEEASLEVIKEAQRATGEVPPFVAMRCGEDGWKPRDKASTTNGEARLEIIAGLTAHHKYENDSCLNFEPVQVNAFARELGRSNSTVSGFFASQFDGYSKYKAACRDKTILINALKMLNGELTPSMLYNALGSDDGNLADD